MDRRFLSKEALNRTFSTREKSLFLILAILLLACLYYLVVWQPSVDAQTRIKSEISQVETDITLQQAIAVQCARLREEIEEAKAKGIKPKELPKGDNTKNIISELNSVLASTKTFNISFEETEASSDIVRRRVKVSFTTDSMGSAETILRNLINCRYTCAVTDFSIARSASSYVSSQTGSTSTTALVTFFEQA